MDSPNSVPARNPRFGELDILIAAEQRPRQNEKQLNGSATVEEALQTPVIGNAIVSVRRNAVEAEPEQKNLPAEGLNVPFAAAQAGCDGHCSTDLVQKGSFLQAALIRFLSDELNLAFVLISVAKVSPGNHVFCGGAVDSAWAALDIAFRLTWRIDDSRARDTVNEQTHDVYAALMRAPTLRVWAATSEFSESGRIA